MNQYNLIFLFSVLLFLSCTSLETNELDSSLTISKNNSISKRVDSIFELMTLEEKIGQLNQYSVGEEMTGPNQNNDYSKQRYNQLINGSVGSVLNLLGAENTRLVQQQVIENSRLKIPLIFAYDVIHGYKTMFPIPLAESCSWDLKLMEKTAKTSAAEAAASGIQWTFAPMIDVSRDARWGRVMEGAGEDPYLGAQVAAARIKGFQGEALSDSISIAACAKHFAAYGFVESGKDYNTVNIGQNTLMNVVMPPFKMAAENNVATFMNAFNDIDGIPATANIFLLKEILREHWNYYGVVVSDWGSIGEMVNHRYSKDLKQAAHQAISAGCDIDMESQAYIKYLKELVVQYPVVENEINRAVKRILTLKFKLGLFDDPYLYSSETREKNLVGSSAHLDLALEAALKSIVLLKNENQLLPLKKDQKIALIGPLANDSDAPLGNWRAHASSNSAISLLDGMRTVFESNITFAKGCELSVGSNNFFEELKINNSDYSGFKQAVDLARKSEIVVMALGEPAYMSGEGRSRSNIDLPGVQLELLKEIYKVNKNIVLVLMNGRPLTIPWEYKNIPAIVEAWHCGSRSGDAIAQILIGDYNPSGKLTMSFPRNVGQVPIYYNKKTTGRPSSGPNQVFYVHHSDVDNDPLFPFGYGLSYTQFQYSEMKISSNEIHMKDTLTVKIKVQNIGNFSGEEIVQLYITDEFASVTLPEIELKGFQKISLAVGESKQVEFNITKEDLSFYNKLNVFIAEPGSFKVGLGTNSKNLDVMSFNLVQ